MAAPSPVLSPTTFSFFCALIVARKNSVRRLLLSPKLRYLKSNSPDSGCAQIAGNTIDGYGIRHFRQRYISKRKKSLFHMCVCVWGGGCVGGCVCPYIPVVPLVRITVIRRLHLKFVSSFQKFLSSAPSYACIRTLYQ